MILHTKAIFAHLNDEVEGKGNQCPLDKERRTGEMHVAKCSEALLVFKSKRIAGLRRDGNNTKSSSNAMMGK